VLVNLVVVARRSKREVEPAIRRLEDILKADPDYVPALTACALAQMTLKQDKARNLLKQVAKMSYQPEFADELELGWLLLAHVYVQKGQFDTAQGLCERCLAANRSCARAYELIGTMKEKQSAFAEAAEHYKEAWLLSSEAAAPIGFKLAFNLLKVRASPAPPPRARFAWRPPHPPARPSAGWPTRAGARVRERHRRLPQGAQGLPGLPQDQGGDHGQGARVPAHRHKLEAANNSAGDATRSSSAHVVARRGLDSRCQCDLLVWSVIPQAQSPPTKYVQGFERKLPWQFDRHPSADESTDLRPTTTSRFHELKIRSVLYEAEAVSFIQCCLSFSARQSVTVSKRRPVN
jgi:tetratricopeptide (TPR) repeat protein